MEGLVKSMGRLFIFGVCISAYETLNSALRAYGHKKGNGFIIGTSKILSIFGNGLNALKYQTCM